MWVVGKAAQVRVVAEYTEAQREAFELIAGELLIGKCHHEVLEPCRPNLSDGLLRKVGAQVDAGDEGAAGLATGFDVDRHLLSVHRNRGVERIER